MKISVEVPEELALQLHDLESQLPQILDLGVRAVQLAAKPQYNGIVQVLEILASLPGPEEIVQLRPSAALQKRVDELLDKSRAGGLSAAEETEWAQYQLLEHLVRIAKARATMKLKAA
ncbi:MAG: hypothetical protein GKR89_23230 [Candidatus Latescibacteria bacterium]|nr:hypothetical protein [Candidatus Latescibacterota bacterium]